MAFFENLSEALTSKGKEAKEAAKKVAEITNLKSQISGIDTEIKKNYRKIGEAYYEAYKDAEVTCEFEESVQAIRDAKKAIAELEKKVRELKGNVECKGCGAQFDASYAYCPKCGTKAEKEFYDEEETDEYTEDIIVPEEVVEVAEEVVEAVEEAEEAAEEIKEEAVEEIKEEAAKEKTEV